MQYIVIVYGASSAILYAQEALDRGYTPIVVNPPIAYDPQEENFKSVIGDSAIYIKGKSLDDNSDVIEQLKKYDIACIVPGSAGGVIYAEKLIDDMGFEGNGYDSLWRRDTKKGMQQSLKEAGIRYIKGEAVNSEEDIRRFFKENNLTRVFMKYSAGASSVGAKLCESVDDAIAHFKSIYNTRNSFGWVCEILIQEYIEGDEYIVNSVSCDGKHMITDIWKYSKVLNADGNMIYDNGELLMSVEPGMHDLIMYTYKVLDATGFKIGPCHGEFKIDEKGPVLIETNPRPMGASMTKEYLDEALGHHIADIALDAYLAKEKFHSRRLKPYRPLKKAIMKFVISPKEAEANLLPFVEILNGLKSFRHTNPIIKDEIVHIHKTTDLETSPMMIKLCHEDANLVTEEARFLHTLETRYIDLIFSMNQVIPGKEVGSYEWTKQYIPPTMKVLFVRNDGDYLYHMKKETHVGYDKWDTYDFIVMMNTQENTLLDKLRYFRYYLSQVRCGGYILIVPEVFANLTYGAAGIEMLLHVLDCRVEVPPMESEGVILAKKI